MVTILLEQENRKNLERRKRKTEKSGLFIRHNEMDTRKKKHGRWDGKKNEKLDGQKVWW